MRILHVIATLNPASGGPAASVRSLLEFSPAGYVNEVLTLDDPEAPFLADLSCPVHALGPTWTKYGFNPRLLPWLRRNRSRFDGILVNGLWQFCGLAVWRACRGRTPYMVFAHGMLDPYFKRTFPGKHFKKWIYWLAAETWVVRSAHHVLFTTEREAQLARTSFHPSRWSAQVVPYGASPPDGDPLAHTQAFFRRFPQLEGYRFLLFLGRIHRKKGCDLLLEAFLQTAALDPGLHLVLAGPLDKRDDHRGQHWRSTLHRPIANAGLSDRVHWTGPLFGDPKWGAFRACEAFILPSHQENFGIAVAEALACGRPVLLSDQVNIAPEIVHAGAGLMAPDTVPGICHLLKSWIQLTQESKETMGVQTHQLFCTRYDMRSNTPAILELFQHCCPEPVPAPAWEEA
jgi:glycosyltransferase involved in cell wall biosynthesis